MPNASSEDTLAPGSVFAGYQIERLLGSGAFGSVYEASRPGSPPVALKVLHVAVEDNEEIVRRFIRESKAIALLKHPNIVASVDVGQHEGRPYLAMERLVGEVLSTLMKREHRLQLGRALDIAVPLMAAVRTVHAQGIVHRDLKPDNIFITYTAEGRIQPKILDFGFAKMAEPGLQLTGKDTAIGTPNFMSPEQMLSPRTVDPRSDQWALGVLLYYMLTGVKPFKGEKLADTLRNVLQSEPTPLRTLCPDLPEPVVKAIERAMQKPPDARFASVHEFAQQLLPFASDATAFSYATEFYTVSVWEQLGEEPPPVQSSRPAPHRPRSRSPSPRGTSSQRAAISSPAALPTSPPTRPSGMHAGAPRTLPSAPPSRSTQPTSAPATPPRGSATEASTPSREKVPMLAYVVAGLGVVAVLAVFALRFLH
jgi:serine/threonine-protein kinase